jgi:HK97 family phage portal protein
MSLVEVAKSVPNTGSGFLTNVAESTRQHSKYYNNAMSEPYTYHSWAYACIQAYTINLAPLDKILVGLDGDGKEKQDDVKYKHDVLYTFQDPNPWMTGQEFWEHVILYLLLPSSRTPGGQCFLVPEKGRGDGKVDLSRGEIPKEWYPFSDNVFSPQIVGGELKGWNYQVPGSDKTILYKPNELIRIRMTNPYHFELGLSPTHAAIQAIKNDVKGDEFNFNYYDNNAFLGGILSSDQDLTREQMHRYMSQFMAKYGGAGNAGTPGMLGAGLKYESIMQDHSKMQFSELRTDSRKRLQSVLRVPDIIISVFTNEMNRATAETGKKTFWEESLLPLDRKICNAINYKWVRYVDGGKYRFKSDLSSISALQQDVTDNIDNMKKLVEMKVPVTEAARITGVEIDTDKYPWLDTVLENFNKVDIGNLVGTSPADMKQDGKEKSVIVTKDDWEEKWYKESDRWIQKVLNPGEKKMRSEIEKFLHMQKREILDKVDSWANNNKAYDGIVTREIIVNPRDFLFKMDEENDKLVNMYTPIAEEQRKRQEDDMKAQYGSVIEWSATRENLEEFVQRRRKQLAEINWTTSKTYRDKLNNIIKQGIYEQWPVRKMAEELKTGINEAGKIRAASANTIARTETATISNQANHEAIAQSESIREKRWITARDEEVRGSHKAQHGMKRAKDEYFPNGLLHPHQHKAPAAEVINCRCKEGVVM